MKITRPIVCLAIAAAFSAGAQQINPITRAMLNGYEEILKENPKDYQTLYERAAQLYRLSQYDKAMNDLVKAVEYTPAKEKDLRVQELSLMTDCAIEMKNYELALRSVEEALAIEPDNYANIYKKGNVCLLLNRPEDAYKAYNGMQRLKTRSQEAYFGMAKACIMMDKMGEATDLLKEAEAADPTNYLTYCRTGNLYEDMGEPEKAASNYLIGFTMAQDPSRPLDALVALGKKDYPAVAAALNYAIERSTSKVPLLYLKGSIAQASGYFADSQDAFDQLSKLPEGNEASVYSGLASSQLALNHPEEALESINKALSLSASSNLYVLKSQILLALDKPAQAVVEASKAVSADTDNVEALLAKAYALTAEKNGAEAVKALNEAIMLSPDNCPALLLRAYVYNNLLDNAKSAVVDFNRLAAEQPETFFDTVCKAIAQAKVGKKIDADTTMDEAMKSKLTPSDLYYAAVYYAQTDNLEKGIEMLKKAVFDGYQNKYNVEADTTPLLNVLPLRRLL